MSTYSFSDINFTMNLAGVGVVNLVGQSVGSVAVSYANDLSVITTSSDGRPITSKIKKNDGTITIVTPATSILNQKFTKWANYVKTAKTTEWINSSMQIRDPYKVGEGGITEYNISGISLQKIADTEFGAEAGEKTWTFMAQNIDVV